MSNLTNLKTRLEKVKAMWDDPQSEYEKGFKQGIDVVLFEIETMLELEIPKEESVDLKFKCGDKVRLVTNFTVVRDHFPYTIYPEGSVFEIKHVEWNPHFRKYLYLLTGTDFSVSEDMIELVKEI